jgi:MFS family permease
MPRRTTSFAGSAGRAGSRAPAFLVAVGIDTLGSGLFLPISLLYFTRVTGVSLSTVGVLLSVATALTLPLPVLIGPLVDALGARRIVVAAQLAQALGLLGYLVVSGPAGIFLAALVVAAGQRAFWSSFFSLVAELSGAERDRESQDRWFAVVGMVQGAAFGAGGLLAGLLLAANSTPVYRVLAVVDAATFLASAALLIIAVRSHPGVRAGRSGRGGYRILLADRPYLALIAVNAAFALCSTLLMVAVPVYVVDGLPAPRWIVGPLLALNTIFLTAGQALMARIVRPLSRVRALVVAGSFWIVWCLGLAGAVRVPAHLLVAYLTLVMLCFTAAELIHGPLSNSLAAAAAPEALRGRYLATFQLSYAVANAVAPGLFAVLFSAGRTLPWLVVAGLTAISTLGMASLERRLPADAVRGLRPAPTTAP